MPKNRFEGQSGQRNWSKSKAEMLGQELAGADLVSSLRRLERLQCNHDQILR